MSREDQRAAAERILAKEPLTEQERQVAEMLSKRPGEYRLPGEDRECGICKEVFRDKVDGKGNVLETAMQQFSDHQSFHNPTADRWAVAHERIQSGKEKVKQAERAE